MELWLFFTIFGAVIFVPSAILFLVLQRFRNTIVVLIKQNGAIRKIIIDNKTLEKGEITQLGKNKIKPIKISKDEIYYGKWRRWIVKPELHSKLETHLTDKEIEEYLNNEDLIKLYLAGKFKDTLILLVGVAIFLIIVGHVIDVYLISSQQYLTYNNASASFIKDNCRQALIELMYNGTGI